MGSKKKPPKRKRPEDSNQSAFRTIQSVIKRTENPKRAPKAPKK